MKRRIIIKKDKVLRKFWRERREKLKQREEIVGG